MRYVGGKARQSKRIVTVIRNMYPQSRRWVEPFMGSGSVSVAAIPLYDEAHLSDAQTDLILLWQAVREGWIPPSHLERDEYNTLRDAEPSALRAWAGFACSYNGKWFSGYGPRAESAGRDYLDEACRSVQRKAPTLALASSIVRRSYDSITTRPGDTIYCDPPYKATLGYGGTESFDSERFWNICRSWVANGCFVFVSEYEAPDDWATVDAWNRSATVDHSSKARRNIESLYHLPR